MNFILTHKKLFIALLITVVAAAAFVIYNKSRVSKGKKTLIPAPFGASNTLVKLEKNDQVVPMGDLDVVAQANVREIIADMKIINTDEERIVATKAASGVAA